MPEHEDTTLAVLRSLDPAVDDVPPAPGSARYDDIRRRVMSEVAPQATGAPEVATPSRHVVRPARRKRLLAWTAAAITAVAASVVAVVAFGGVGGGPAADQVVLVAADTTAKVTSLRGVSETTAEDGGKSSSTVEASGDDLSIVTVDGLGTITSISIGDTFYEKTEQDAEFRTGTLDPESTLAPYAESAAAVVRAALRGGTVEEIGEEKVRGAETTHYRLPVTGAARDALAALPAQQTAWFELEQADEVSSIDVWVSGDLIHRITVDQGPRQAAVEFFDFGAPIRITAPPGF
ncbi:hypothetical protein ACIA8K_24915 [Catenuloplanes sp. NPDC051500]|uniref:hypothetical protein n=1 Tax=Catenuloplanes sp. NPDC051500 TaxID=3363959 RepID=UPI0037A64C1E